MFSRLYSFKFIISVALFWLGALAYGLAIYSTQVYHGHAIENHLESLQTVLELKSREVITDLYQKQARYAERLQNEAQFKTALKNGSPGKMEAWLGESYSNYQVSTGDIKLKTIIVRRPSGEIFAQSSDDGLKAQQGCPDSLDAIGGSLVLVKPQNRLCTFDSQPYSEVMVPVGAPEPVAYLQIVAYTLNELKEIERDIGIPLRITNSSGFKLYQSEKWVADQTDTHLYPVYKLYGDDSFIAATITAAFDQQPFLNRLKHFGPDPGTGVTESGVFADEQLA